MVWCQSNAERRCWPRRACACHIHAPRSTPLQDCLKGSTVGQWPEPLNMATLSGTNKDGTSRVLVRRIGDESEHMTRAEGRHQVSEDNIRFVVLNEFSGPDAKVKAHIFETALIEEVRSGAGVIWADETKSGFPMRGPWPSFAAARSHVL